MSSFKHLALAAAAIALIGTLAPATAEASLLGQTIGCSVVVDGLTSPNNLFDASNPNGGSGATAVVGPGVECSGVGEAFGQAADIYSADFSEVGGETFLDIIFSSGFNAGIGEMTWSFTDLFWDGNPLAGLITDVVQVDSTWPPATLSPSHGDNDITITALTFNTEIQSYGARFRIDVEHAPGTGPGTGPGPGVPEPATLLLLGAGLAGLARARRR